MTATSRDIIKTRVPSQVFKKSSTCVSGREESSIGRPSDDVDTVLMTVQVAQTVGLDFAGLVDGQFPNLQRLL